VIIELFSLAVKANALLSEIYRNRHFLKGWVTLSANSRLMGPSPQSIYGPLDRGMTLKVFTQRNFAEDFFDSCWVLLAKTKTVCATLWGT